MEEDLSTSESSGVPNLPLRKITRAAENSSFLDPMEDRSKTVSLEEDSDDEDQVRDENSEHRGLVSFVEGQYERAKTKRQSDETRWLECYRNYRGLYGPDVQFTETERSQVFVKVTKTKVNAAYAKIVDVLFSGAKFPIGIEASPVPTGVFESVHFDLEDKSDEGDGSGEEQEGGADSGSPISGMVSRPDILDSVGPFKEQLSRLPDKKKLKEGPGKTPTSHTFEPAKEAARRMEKIIQDQLLESDASKELRNFVFEMCLFGTGVMKGPFAIEQENPKWTADGTYEPEITLTAESTQRSIWDIFPDPDARMMSECEYLVDRHRMSKSELRALKRRPHFRKTSIDLAIDAGPDYQNEYWEEAMRDNEANYPSSNRYEVLEYWGVIDKDLAEKSGVEIPEELESFDEVQINIWICNGYLLRVVMNPFTPSRIPYYACPYEINPYSFFGIGVAENMNDTQLVMNGMMRQTIDNSAFSGNVVFEVDETNLVPGQSMEIFPGKVFRRQAGAPGQAIFATKFPNVAQENMLVFDKARQLADEATGIPSYSHGMSGVMNTGRTAAGMSMLMGAADQNIKAVVRNVDDYLLVPWGKAYFAFNMQFNFDEKNLGDLQVVSRGTESLMQTEVRSQKLLQFLQLTSNPQDAPYVKRSYLLREIAAGMDLEPDKTVNDEREAAIQAALIAERQKQMGIDPQQGNPTGAPSPSDPTGTGGGNIAPGNAPPPGQPGYTGAGGGANTPEAQATQEQTGM